MAVLASILFGETLSGAGYIGLVIGLLGLVLLEVTPETISNLLNDGDHKYQSAVVNAPTFEALWVVSYTLKI